MAVAMKLVMTLKSSEAMDPLPSTQKVAIVVRPAGAAQQPRRCTNASTS